MGQHTSRTTAQLEFKFLNEYDLRRDFNFKYSYGEYRMTEAELSKRIAGLDHKSKIMVENMSNGGSMQISALAGDKFGVEFTTNQLAFEINFGVMDHEHIHETGQYASETGYKTWWVFFEIDRDSGTGQSLIDVRRSFGPNVANSFEIVIDYITWPFGLCEDKNDEAVDSTGDGCKFYVEHPDWCGHFDTDAFAAKKMCCACYLEPLE